MKALAVTLQSLPGTPLSIPLTSPRLGVSALKAFSLARTAWASWAVSSGPLEVRHRGIRIWGLGRLGTDRGHQG